MAGIALNKGVVRDLSILSIVNSWAIAQVLLTLSFLRLNHKAAAKIRQVSGTANLFWQKQFYL